MRGDLRRLRPYGAVLLFCLLSSARDVWSEGAFKRSEPVDPLFVLFVYAAVGMVAAIVYGAIRRQGIVSVSANGRALYKELALASLWTALSFTAFVLAIATPLGATLNAFVDYGAGPVMTAVAARVVLGERFSTRFSAAFLLSLAGAVLLLGALANGLEAGRWSALWGGLALAVTGSLGAAMYRVYYKQLLNASLPKPSIVFYRMAILVVGLGIVVVARRPVPSAPVIVEVALVGLAGFAIPIFVMLSAMEELRLLRFALLLFLAPLTTFLFSLALGRATLSPANVAGMGLIVAGVWVSRS